MTVVTAQEAPTFELGNALITALAAPSRGSTSTSAWRVQFTADAPSPRHSLTAEEIFVVVDGSVTAQYTDREETAEVGGALIVAAGQQFSIVARGAPAEAICILPVGGEAHADGATFVPPWAV